MNILFASVGDNGAGSWFMSQAVNKHTDHAARAVRWMDTYIHYPVDVYQPSASELKRLVDWADVIWVRDGAPDVEQSPKFKGITFTGMSFRKRPDALVSHYAKRGVKVCVSTPDLTSYHSAVTWLPNPREEKRPIQKRPAFTVAHAPTYRDRKGTETVIAACAAAGVELDLIEQANYADCIRRKLACHLLVDQFAFGYGNNAIEAWAGGLPALSGASDKKYQAETLRLFGALPYWDCRENLRELTRALQMLRDEPQKLAEIVARGHDYFMRFHYAPAVAQRLIKIIEGGKDG